MSIRLLSVSSDLRRGLRVDGLTVRVAVVGATVVWSDSDVGTGLLTRMNSEWSSQGEEATSIISSLLMVGITMVRPSCRTMVSLIMATLLKDTVMSSPLRRAPLVTGMSPLLLIGMSICGIFPLDMFASFLWVVVASPKLLGVVVAALRYHRGVCARVVGSSLGPVSTGVRGTLVLDGTVEDKCSVTASGSRVKAWN